jgi:hypothetical protein
VLRWFEVVCAVVGGWVNMCAGARVGVCAQIGKRRGPGIGWGKNEGKKGNVT